MATVAVFGFSILPAGAGIAAQRGRAGTAAGLAAFRAPVKWGACAHGIPSPFQCGHARVPLDYQNPSGKTIRLALIRLPAARPSKRIGSLFVNFGGPGGNGVTALRYLYTVFPWRIRARFDLVSWDPRGIEYSDPVNCFASLSAAQAYFNSIPAFPYPQTKAKARAYFRKNAQLGADCASRDAALLAHMSTADTARDLDLLRQDVGDAKLNYIGFSYGTVIGATYANLFPSNVRAMVLDGSLDFVGNAVGVNPGDGANFPIDVRQGVDVAAQDVMSRFLSLCAQAGKSACALAKGKTSPQAKWAALLQRAQAKKISYPNLMLLVYNDLTDPIAQWPGLASYLQNLYHVTSAGRRLGPAGAASLATAARRAMAGPAVAKGGAAGAAYTSNETEAFYAIQCADSVVPAKRSVYRNLAVSEDAKVPGFGRFVVYDMMPCATWPDMHEADAYDGPWNLSQTTILVINALHDPETPYQGAQAGAAELGNADLLTVDGDGHTSMYVEPSKCRDNAEFAYLVAGTLPPQGTVCPVDKLPFGLP